MQLTESEKLLLHILFRHTEPLTWAEIARLMPPMPRRQLRKIKEGLCDKNIPVDGYSGRQVNNSGRGNYEAGIYLCRTAEQRARGKEQAQKQALKILARDNQKDIDFVEFWKGRTDYLPGMEDIK
jgi:hypothetical protein